MKIPYLTNYLTRQKAKELRAPATGGIAVKVFGIIIYELPFTPETLKMIEA
jgi:hypothetical protein